MKILIVDSSRFERDSISKVLKQSLMADFLKAGTPVDALRMIEDHPDIQVIISDFYLNGGKGDKILTYLKQKKKLLPFIWLTEEKEDSKIIKESLEEGELVWYVQKPYKADSLVFMVRNAMALLKQKIMQAEKGGEKKKTDEPAAEGADSEAKLRTKKLLEQLQKQKGKQNESESLRLKKQKAKRVDEVLKSLDERTKKKKGAQKGKSLGNSPDLSDADNVPLPISRREAKKKEDTDSRGPNDFPSGDEAFPIESLLESYEKEADEADAKQQEHSAVLKKDTQDLDWSNIDTSQVKRDGEDPNVADLPGFEGLKMTDGLEREDLAGVLERFIESSPEKFTTDLAESELANLILKAEIFDSDEFVNEQINRFTQFNMVNCNLYLRLSKSKLVKIVNAFDVYDKELIEKYQKKDVNYIYINQEEYPRFRELYGNYLRSNLRVRDLSNKPKIIDPILNDDLTRKLKYVGINDETLKIGEKLVHESIELVRSSPKAIPQLKEAYEANPFIKEHSLMLVYVCTQVALHIQMDAPTTLQKLAIAALFHDVVMENYSLAHVQDFESKVGKLMSSHERREYKKHCQAACDLIREGRDLHPDVDEIILQHHESPDGKGFPWKLSPTRVSPLAALFIIAEDFVHYLYFTDLEDIDLDSLLKKFGTKYFHGNYVVPLEGFLRSFYISE